MKTKQIVLAGRPEGVPKQADFGLEETELPELKQGEVLVQAQFISVDPYLRGRMNESAVPGAAFKLNEPLVSAVVAKVIESKTEHFSAGDLVSGNLPWAENTVAKENQLQKIDVSNVPASAYLGLLGMTGLTAYFGLLEVGKPKAGETVVISGAAGAVGTVAGQIARLKGCRVIGIAGTDDKLKMLKNDFGFNEAINYKTDDIAQKLSTFCPKGIDVYFDNVGGEISETVIGQINLNARVAVCGQISTYNQQQSRKSTLDILPLILNKSATVQGFHVPNYQSQYNDAIVQLSAWYQQGKIKSKETVMNGFERLPEAFIGLYSGKNEGKMLVKL